MEKVFYDIHVVVSGNDVIYVPGGPLFEGDIEDYNGRCHVMCPWHSYMFDLETGKNEIGLQVNRSTTTGYNQSVTGCGFQRRHVVVTQRKLV